MSSSTREVVKLLGDMAPKCRMTTDNKKDGRGEDAFHEFEVVVYN